MYLSKPNKVAEKANRSLLELSKQEDMYRQTRQNIYSSNDDISKWVNDRADPFWSPQKSVKIQPKKSQRKSDARIKLQKLYLPKLSNPYIEERNIQIREYHKRRASIQHNYRIKNWSEKVTPNKPVFNPDDILEAQKRTLASLRKNIGKKSPVAIRFPAYSLQRNKAIVSHLRYTDRSLSIQELQIKIKKIEKLRQLHNSSLQNPGTFDIKMFQMSSELDNISDKERVQDKTNSDNIA